jgi:hypothetical protein
VIVARLLAAGADPSAPEASGWTPLHSAAISGHERLARALLDAGARVDTLVEHRAGSTPLAYALFYGHTWAAQTIARDQPVPDDLRTAAALGDLERMHRWIDGGRPLPVGADSGMDFYGPTDWFPPRREPVTDQVAIDESLACEWLLDHGVDPDLRHDFGGAGHGVQAVAMHLAAQYGSLGCLQLLLRRGADATITDGAY